MINWGIVGLGNMANRFASSINEVKNSKLISIASTNFLRLKSFGDKYNIDKKYRYKNYDEILNCDEINAIYISTLNNTHSEIVIKAAEAKKNILVIIPVFLLSVIFFDYSVSFTGGGVFFQISNLILKKSSLSIQPSSF